MSENAQGAPEFKGKLTDDDVEGHVRARIESDDDVEGHVKARLTDDDDVEGHVRTPHAADDEDDVEGHVRTPHISEPDHEGSAMGIKAR